jgi:alpha-tubulin suppressor-like RCC1 family protein
VSGPNASTDLFSQVGAGDELTCGLRIDGRLMCWGNNGDGQVSGPNGDTSTFSQVSAAEEHVCALKANGRLACWGDDSDNRVSGPNASTSTFTYVSVGEGHTCGLKTTGRIMCWGYDGDDQVSGPNGSSDKFTQITADIGSTCGLKTNGRLACWGYDGSGQVSGPNGSTDTFTQVSAGGYTGIDCCPDFFPVGHTCGLKKSGEIECWGADDSGDVSGPNASPDDFGYPPAQLVMLQQRIQGFGMRQAQERRLLDLLKKVQIAVTAGKTSQACAALAQLDQLISAYSGKSGPLTPYQGAVTHLAVQGLGGSIGCA